jgi:hypothetical protein
VGGERLMAEPRNASKAKGKRYYMWESPEATERYWSVTTIIDGGIPKPALLGWAVKQTAIYAIENHQLLGLHIAKDLDDSGQLPPADPDTRKPTGRGCLEAYKLLWDARRQVSERAANLGTRIHEAIEAYVLDKPAPEWPEDVRPFLENAMAFLRDFEVMVEMTEASVFNRSQRYAGTLDMIATINGERWLIDFKTGSGVHAEAALQMSAYAHAEFIGRPDNSEEPMPRIDHAAIVHLRPEHYSFIPVRIDDAIFNTFLYAREVFRWAEETSKKVVGDSLASLDDLTSFLEERSQKAVTA